MRRSTVIVLAIFAVIAGFAYSSTSASRQSRRPALSKNGKTNPSSIPDYIAFEFFFESLVTSPFEGDKGRRRVEAFAKRTGIQDSQIEPLLTEAQNVYQQITQFDKQVKAIKDHTWPDPEAETWTELRGIENQKRTAIMEEANSLLTRSGAETEAKIRAFVTEHVKRRIVGYASEPNPGQQPRPHHADAAIVSGAILSPFLPMNMQMGDETVYIYADAAYSPGDETVYGYGDVRATAGSYGQEYFSRTELHGPCGHLKSNDGTMAIGDCDGVYSFYCEAVQSCPILNTSGDAGSAGDSTQVAPFIRVLRFGSFNPKPINNGSGTSYISLSIRASANANATVAIETSYYTVSGVPPIRIGSGGSGSFSISRGTQVTRTISYSPTLITTNPTKVKAEALVTANVRVMNNDPISTSILTIIK